MSENKRIIPVVRVIITPEMFKRAKREESARESDIMHYFKGPKDQNVIGFLGEFAAAEYFNFPWKGFIRETYKSIDMGDLTVDGKVIDVKTMAAYYTIIRATLIAQHNVPLNDVRYFNAGQAELVAKYDLFLFGILQRGKDDELPYPYWYPQGMVERGALEEIIESTQPNKTAPDGRQLESPNYFVPYDILRAPYEFIPEIGQRESVQVFDLASGTKLKKALEEPPPDTYSFLIQKPDKSRSWTKVEEN